MQRLTDTGEFKFWGMDAVVIEPKQSCLQAFLCIYPYKMIMRICHDFLAAFSINCTFLTGRYYLL